MSAKITFTDGTGAATLDNGFSAVANAVACRFSNWVPITTPIGTRVQSLGTGQTSMFAFRTDYGASFELREIQGDNIAVAARLRAWLLGGGQCAVYTDDSAGATYLTCGLMPGTEPALTQQDPTELTYALSLSLINLAGSPVPMTCKY